MAGDPYLANYPYDYPKPFCTRFSVYPHLYETPATCMEAKDPTPLEDTDEAVLFAEGTAKITDLVYPDEVHELTTTFLKYDEPLTPPPAGASIFYFVCIAWMTTFYFTYLGRKMLAKVKDKLELHPEANRFPNIPLYWLQQSKREAELRREVRNTWAWLARRYLLSPNDPLLANVDQVLGLVNWQDFEVVKNTWSMVKMIMKLNHLYLKVKKSRYNKAMKEFTILTQHELNPNQQRQLRGNQRVIEEWDWSTQQGTLYDRMSRNTKK